MIYLPIFPLLLSTRGAFAYSLRTKVYIHVLVKTLLINVLLFHDNFALVSIYILNSGTLFITRG